MCEAAEEGAVILLSAGPETLGVQHGSAGRIPPSSRAVFLLPTLGISWSWFAEGWDKFLAPGWGSLHSCNTGDGHRVSVSLCYPVQQQDFL